MIQDQDHRFHLSDRPALLARLPNQARRRAIREAAGFTLHDLAEALGINASTVHGWEQGRTPSRLALRPYVDLLDELARRSDEKMRDIDEDRK